MSNLEISYIDEPQLVFGYNQEAKDPRDGLILYGPHESFIKNTLRAGIIGTEKANALYSVFVDNLNAPIFSSKKVYGKLKHDEVQRPSFPGFESVFNVKWPSIPETQLLVPDKIIRQIIQIEKIKKKRTSRLVDLFIGKIVEFTNSEQEQLDIWFIIVPTNVWKFCRPMSKGKDIGKATQNFLEMSKSGQSSMFGDDAYNEEIEKLMGSSSNFHHLLKARLIEEKIQTPVQIILESTLAFRDKMTNTSFEPNMKAHIAWTQSTTLFYKLGKLPWKLTDIRDGVCYIGLVFKQLSEDRKNEYACSAAQMFLKDGDGTVFRGNIGLWKSPNKEYHLDTRSAEELLGMALDDYFDKWSCYPIEMFIHGRANFTDAEWKGFTNALETRRASTSLVGITIKYSHDLKFFRDAIEGTSKYGVLRGIALNISAFEAYLFTIGYVPRLQTSLSMEIPNPIHIRINRGTCDLDIVLKDIMALTKLNYNACIYGDGLPVTLKFSNIIGDILTASKNIKSSQRKFIYYI